MLMKLGASLVIYIWLLMAILSSTESSNDARPAVLDTEGNPLQSGVEYYVRPAITDNGGYFTLINRNDSCPLYVGQQNVVEELKFPLKFTPFIEGENVIRQYSDFKAVFQAFTLCLQSTAWKVGEEDPESGRRLIVTGEEKGIGGYFRIEEGNLGTYHFAWCPTEVCPTCRLRCSPVGVLTENDNRLLALDGGDGLPVIFERANEVSS